MTLILWQLLAEGSGFLSTTPSQPFIRTRLLRFLNRKTARNFNPAMCKAAKFTIAEVEEIVEIGDIDPDEVHIPSIYVQAVVIGNNYVKRIEVRTPGTVSPKWPPANPKKSLNIRRLDELESISSQTFRKTPPPSILRSLETLPFSPASKASTRRRSGRKFWATIVSVPMF